MTEGSSFADRSDLVVSLNDDGGTGATTNDDVIAASRVGGKASSLARLSAMDEELRGDRRRGGNDDDDDDDDDPVPFALALTVDFFAPWIDAISRTDDHAALTRLLATTGHHRHRHHQQQEQEDRERELCAKLQDRCPDLPVSAAQSDALASIAAALDGRLAAVRSSAPEEDGAKASFAGAFATKLAVRSTSEDLTVAVKECFAGLWEHRVIVYRQRNRQERSTSSSLAFAVVVMEMVDSVVAGVAFSANPINSDRDEMVINASWGLGESVVDGSVSADRYVVDKLRPSYPVIEETLGRKGAETRISPGEGGGLLRASIPPTDPRFSEPSLRKEQIEELAALVCAVERAYGTPVDVEWAFVNVVAAVADEGDADGTERREVRLRPKLLQARPITTLYTIDPEMMTSPGERRVLYFDRNVVSEATTTTPFSTLDMDVYCKAMYAGIFGGAFGDAEADGMGIFHQPRPKTSLMFNGSTRQYFNMGWVLNLVGKEAMAKQMEFIDPYLTSIIASEDFDPRRYRTSFWVPEGLSFTMVWRMIQFGRKVSGGESYLEDPEGSMDRYFALKESNEREFDRIARTGAPLLDGNVGGLKDFATLLYESIRPTLVEEMIIINNHVLAVFQEVDDQRRNGKTEEIRKDFEALCGGYEGDVLMELNIALHRLGRSLPKDAWKDGSSVAALADRIAEERDLPAEFLTEWRSFLDRYGFDGQDQLFVASPRYRDSPSRLLEMMRMNASDSAKDPSASARDLLSKRRAVMAKQEAAAARELDGCSHLRAWTRWKLRRKLDAVRRRNTVLDRFMRLRNSPKMHLTKLVGTLRSAVLRIEEKLIAEGRLREKGDVFHLTMDEIDEALSEGRRRPGRTGDAAAGTTTTDLTALVGSRKPGYDAAVAAKTCPLLIDSRCRILKPDPPPAFRGGGSKEEEGAVLVGSAISPGIATGTIRIVTDLSPERTRSFGIDPETGGPATDHVLCAVVTGPAWTPLFASASAVILQVGGVLQHGALCAREFGTPAVSGIDVGALRDGARVRVDGTAGTVTILDD